MLDYATEDKLSSKYCTMPFPRVEGVETSVTIAVPRLMLPLLIPPIIRAITKTVKLVDEAQTA